MRRGSREQPLRLKEKCRPTSIIRGSTESSVHRLSGGIGKTVHPKPGGGNSRPSSWVEVPGGQEELLLSSRFTQRRPGRVNYTEEQLTEIDGSLLRLITRAHGECFPEKKPRRHITHLYTTPQPPSGIIRRIGFRSGFTMRLQQMTSFVRGRRGVLAGRGGETSVLRLWGRSQFKKSGP